MRQLRQYGRSSPTSYTRTVAAQAMIDRPGAASSAAPKIPAAA